MATGEGFLGGEKARDIRTSVSFSFHPLVPVIGLTQMETRGAWQYSPQGKPSVQFSHSVCPTLCDPMDCSMPGFLIHHQLLELAQGHVHQVGDAVQSPHPLSSPPPPTFSHYQHQGLFQGVSSLHQVAKVLEFQLQHQSFQ